MSHPILQDDDFPAHALPILRGLLAAPSGSEDDPWRRPLLLPFPSPAPAAGAPPPLPFDTAGEETDDALRARGRQALEAYRAQYGTTPACLVMAGAAYRVAPAPLTAMPPLNDKIALVTGAAGAIGAGICRLLLDQGARVVAGDLAPDALAALTTELGPSAPDRLLGVRMDVTDQESVTQGFAQTARAWGGVDLVVVNAGIAMVAPLMELDPDAFRKLERVNVEGALLTLAEAGRYLRRQGTGGDIVVVSTKNVFAPGAQFGAYSATKAACHQLARIASLEFAPFDVRVNMVAPDAVFGDAHRKSGLWAEVGPSRMKARGLDERGLEHYYRDRNLLKARVTPEHVARAVLFFATRQTPTTGATLPVDGGLPDATPR